VIAADARRAADTIQELGRKTMPNEQLPVLSSFVESLRTIWSSNSDIKTRMEKAKPMLEKLVRDDALKAMSAIWPSTEGGKNLLLYVDPDHGFAINAVVRVPGRKGRPHDHGEAWVLYGVLDGAESLERYDRIDDGSKPGFAQIKMTSVTTGSQGKVDLVAPHDIHAEQGGNARSVAIILRSQKLGGTNIQHGYNVSDGTVEERYGPRQISYELTA
jgi:predicted metal-dependent enzyme (double-stranded beta helix superfamily)